VTTAAATSASANSDLPRPAERPEADVVIYDGHCRICIGQVARLARWDTRQRLAFLSLHDGEVYRRWPDLKHEDLMREMYVVDRRGRRHRGAAAFRYLSTRLPRLYPLAPLLHLPGTLWLWQWCYQQVARRRYRYGRTDDCPDGACAVHGKPK
jgi:predicted DCC family thiol-disulfide oxidoreductase YuxK